MSERLNPTVLRAMTFTKGMRVRMTELALRQGLRACKWKGDKTDLVYKRDRRNHCRWIARCPRCGGREFYVDEPQTRAGNSVLNAPSSLKQKEEM